MNGLNVFPTEHTLALDLHMAFKIPYLHDFLIKLCRKQATLKLNHENVNIRHIGQGKAQHRKYERLKLGGSQAK
jgi:hypothetical protein